MVVFVEAKDPSDGAKIVLQCSTRGQAVAALERFATERLLCIKVTDLNGTVVPETDL